MCAASRAATATLVSTAYRFCDGTSALTIVTPPRDIRVGDHEAFRGFEGRPPIELHDATTRLAHRPQPQVTTLNSDVELTVRGNIQPVAQVL